MGMQSYVVATPTLAKGEIRNLSTPAVVEEQIGGHTFSVSRVVVKARPEQCYQVLTDYANAPSVFPTLKKCQVLEDHGATKLVRHVLAPTGQLGKFDYTLELKEEHNKALSWKRVRGDFKELEGYWRLEPLDGGRSTLVTYSTYANGGIMIPQCLIRRQFHIDMPAVMMALKQQAESTTEIASGHANERKNPL